MIDSAEQCCCRLARASPGMGGAKGTAVPMQWATTLHVSLTVVDNMSGSNKHWQKCQVHYIPPS